MSSMEHRQVAGNEDLIKRLFNKVYSAIISEKIFCPPETAVYLAAYACQAKFGSAKACRNPVPPVKELLPKSILENHTLSITDWETRISNWHLKLRDVPFLDSIVEYVDVAQDVELYGASIFEVETNSNVRKWISIDAVGLNIYDSKRKPPTKRYFWSDIHSFTAWNEKIEIVLTHAPDQVIEFFVHHQLASDLLQNLFHGSKELYAKRKKSETSNRYVRRSESNSSMRMRPHKLSSAELHDLEQSITELELELPRRATDFEYAAWQVKSQLRQAMQIDTKLSLNIPSTEETRRLQHKVAQIRVFLEQDCFASAEEEPVDRPHRYRGNFAIRVGGAYSGRLEGYSSDIDSGDETTVTNGAQSWRNPVHSAEKVQKIAANSKQSPLAVRRLSDLTSPSSSENEGGRTTSRRSDRIDQPTTRISENSTPAQQTMPSLPTALSTRSSDFRPQASTSSRHTGPVMPPSYKPEMYPNAPDLYRHPSFTADEPSLSTSMPTDGPGYPDVNPHSEMEPPASVSTPTTWQNADIHSRQSNSPYSKVGPLGSNGAQRDSIISPKPWQTVQQMPSQPSSSSPFTKGRVHGQLVEPESSQLFIRPPLQPKPKVAPRTTADPQMVTPEHYGDADSARASGRDSDLKFSSLKVIQSGFAKKRVDLFEAM